MPREQERERRSAFFASQPKAQPVFEAAVRTIRRKFPSVGLRVESNQIAFDDPHAFAYAWLPPGLVNGRPEECVVLSFVLPRAVEHARISNITFVRADRYTHHVPLHVGRTVDQQVLDWLSEAHDLMRSTYRRGRR
ncbi:DUF5655 domain-containing protein [Eubacteriales bacterium OttesenSCG-928-N13]|nr:DUF5655 domain-containing protein [Eubacteriales bacterium OttesenSCG-928-N13]